MLKETCADSPDHYRKVINLRNRLKCLFQRVVRGVGLELYGEGDVSRTIPFFLSVVGVKFYPKHNYFVPFECFAGSETCFFSFLFSSFSLCSFLCCSKPAAFFSLLDKTASTLTGSRSVTHSKALSFCLHLKGRILDSYTTPIPCSRET